MLRYLRFVFAACLAVLGGFAFAPATRAQSFAGICADSTQENSIQCQALKTADEEVKKAVADVPTPGYTMGPEVSVAALCNGMTPAGTPGAKVPPEAQRDLDIVRRYQRGEPLAAIQEAHRISTGTLFRILHSHGVKSNRNGRRSLPAILPVAGPPEG